VTSCGCTAWLLTCLYSAGRDWRISCRPEVQHVYSRRLGRRSTSLIWTKWPDQRSCVNVDRSYKQRDLKLALQLQCAWPPGAGPSEPAHTGRCVLASTHRPVVTGRGACWPAYTGQWPVHWAKRRVAAVCAGCWAMPGTTDARDQCMLAYFTTRQLLLGVQQYNTDVCGQKFAVLWLKITFHFTLSQLKSINLYISRDL